MLPRACAVGKGHELHAGAESKAKPPLQKHRCQCSVPGQCSPTRGREAAGRLGEALGHSGGCHSGVQRSCSLSRATQHHDHSSLSRVSECKGPGSHIQQGKDPWAAPEGKKQQPAVCFVARAHTLSWPQHWLLLPTAQSTSRCSAPSSLSPGYC